jgi:hypothetical protein
VNVRLEGERARRELHEAHETLQAFAGNDTLAHVVTMLTALAATYKADMVTCEPEVLLNKQRALKQTLAIRDSLLRGGDEPRI